jgi:hypothetical protein
MKTSMAVGAAALTLAMVVSPAEAQVVQAGVVIRGGPVRGHVVVGEPAPVVVYRRPVRHVVVVERYHPRTIVVERFPERQYRSQRWWRRHGYAATTVYYDGDDDCYYDRPIYGRRGLDEVTVYERDGRYYSLGRDNGDYNDGDHDDHDDRHHGDD